MPDVAVPDMEDQLLQMLCWQRTVIAQDVLLKMDLPSSYEEEMAMRNAVLIQLAELACRLDVRILESGPCLT